VKISSYFRDLSSAYQAELDDLTSDSEGKDVLRRRLADKRKEIGFLVQMLELAPEMVAVVFHQGFRFTQPAALEHVLSQHADTVSDWHSLTGAVALEPWAVSLAHTVLQEPQGARFMAVAAALEYLHQNVRSAPSAQANSDGDAHAGEGEDEDEDSDAYDNDGDSLSADDARDPQNSRTREEASDQWLSDVGFDPKK